MKKSSLERLKLGIASASFLVVIFLSFYALKIKEKNEYIEEYNSKFSSIISVLKEKYPLVIDSEIMDIVNSNEEKSDMFRDYGFNISKEPIADKNSTISLKYSIYKIILSVLVIILFVAFFIYNKLKEKRQIKDVIELVERINNKEYNLDIEKNTESELSILRNEIYKTMITLKESAENSINDKMKVKEALEDISHQLKTPLTAILINLDNLTYAEDLSKEEKDKFLRNIRSKIYNMKFLIESLLKLSKFDVNTVDFNEEKVDVKTLVKSAIDDVSTLADIKNINIIQEINDEVYILCDMNWQKEALVNILKNALEHSKENSKVTISLFSNSVKTAISVTNYGSISKKDIKHIFERFYKGENSSEESVGIGLALSKAIVEKGRGKIKVSSEDGKTIFTITYYN